MKKFLIAFLSAMCGMLCLVACDKTGDDSTQGKEKTLAFAGDSVSVEMFSSKQLDYDYKNIEGDITFTSSDPSVATVDGLGRVSAHKNGTAVITAAVDGISDTITVTVLACDQSKLELFYEFDTLNIYETYSKEITPVVLYEDRAVEGGVFSYEISSDGNATLKGNKVTGVNKGASTLTISGSIAGIALEDVTVSLNVFEKLEIAMETTKEEIFISAGTSGQNAKTEFELNPKVMLNDVELTDAEIIRTIDGEGIISIKDGIVSAVSVGTAVVTFSYTSEKDTFVQSVLTVVVGKPTVTYDLPNGEIAKNKSEFIEFEVATATSVPELFFDGKLIAPTNYKVEGGVLKINPSAFTNVIGDNGFATEHSVQIIAENNTERFVYTQTFNLIDFEIGTKEEFIAWADAVRVMTDKNNATKFLYAVLTDNIDLTGEAFINTKYGAYNGTSTPHNGFGLGYLCGVMDGQGYTVNSLEHDRGGLFAGIAKGGFVFKNIAFTNIELGRNDATSVRYVFGTSATGDIALENVYLQISKVPYAQANTTVGIINDGGALDMKNCIISYRDIKLELLTIRIHKIFGHIDSKSDSVRIEKHIINILYNFRCMVRKKFI